ncbi:hypothetical protein ABNZ43_04595 [Weissella sp. GP1]|uniref:hypothetical protein n=1 Tax=Weissella confusa TaxID=1583 RepID=UPI0032DBBD4B
MGKKIGIIVASIIALALVILGGLAVVGSHVHHEKQQTQAKQSSESKKASSEKTTSKATKNEQSSATSSTSSQSSASSEVSVENMTDVQVDDALKKLTAEERGALILREWSDRTSATNNWLPSLIKSDIHTYLAQDGDSEGFGVPSGTDGSVMGVKIDGDNRIVTSRYNGDAGNFTMSMRAAYRKYFIPSEVAYTEQVASKITTDKAVFDKELQAMQEKNDSSSSENGENSEQVKLNRAKAWVAVMGMRIVNDNEDHFNGISVQTISAGAPVINGKYTNSIVFPTDVVEMIATPLAEGMVTYHDNGDGSITVYGVPTHLQDPAWLDPQKSKEMAQHILDTAHVVSVNNVSNEDAEKVADLIQQ